MEGLEIPEYCGAILLPGVTLFPQGALPLNIFEPRYREMLDDALRGSSMFAVGTLIEEESENPAKCVAPVGTMGLIRASHEQEDGTSQLLLHGVIRIRFEDWLSDTSYPHARISPVVTGKLPEWDQDEIIEKLSDAVDRSLYRVDKELHDPIRIVFDKIRSTPSTLVDVVSQQFIQDPTQRRYLLEETDLTNRYELLTGYLNQAAQEDGH